jgi:hypothetical protein
MNYDNYIKKLHISLSKYSQYEDIVIMTYERYNSEYETINRSILLQYKEPVPKKKNEYYQYKEWLSNKKELLMRLNELWLKRKQTKK